MTQETTTTKEGEMDGRKLLFLPDLKVGVIPLSFLRQRLSIDVILIRMKVRE